MVQDGSLDFRLVQRVCALQQALDQALLSLEDLRGQLQDQDWLETQLAKTEKYANVQQQAIAYLKSQLSQVTNHQRHVLHQLLVHLEDWVNGQQVALNRLQLQIDQGEAELQTFLQHIRTRSPDQSPFIPASNSCEMDLEAEVMVARSATVSLGTQLQAARYHLQTLTQVLHQHHGDMTQLAIAIQTMLNTLAAEREAATLDLEPEEAATAQPEVIPLLPEPDEASLLHHALRMQQVRIRELETTLADQFSRQTQLKQRCQTLAAERDYYKRQAEQQALPAAPALAWEEESALGDIPGPRRLRFQSPPPIQPLQVDEAL
jgi:hypothetical protein